MELQVLSMGWSLFLWEYVNLVFDLKEYSIMCQFLKKCLN